MCCSKMKTKTSFVAALMFHLKSSVGVNTVPPTNLKCPASQVFDYSGFECSSCDLTGSSGLQPDTTSVGYNGNSLTCRCPAGLLQNSTDCSIQSLWQGDCKELFCSAECNVASKVASLDQQRCIPCSNSNETDSSFNTSSEYDSDLNQCICRNPAKGRPTGKSVVSKRLVEIYDDESGLPLRNDCLRCPEGTAVITKDLYDDGQDFLSTAGVKYLADPYSCSSCPDPNMFFDTDYSCVCVKGFYLTGEASVGEQSCIERNPSVSSNSKVRFRDLPSNNGSEAFDFTLESIVFSHYYSRAASNCEYYKGSSGRSLQSCQTLSNLCVMSMYDEESPACKQLQTIFERRVGTYHGRDEWKNTLPWIYYRDGAEDVIGDREIKMKMSFHEKDGHTNILTFKLAKYTLNGTFVGIDDLAHQLEYCIPSKDRDGLIPPWLTFGNSMRSQNSCSISNLLEKEMFFYEMYIVDESLESCTGAECLYPVPVLNKNFAQGGSFPNINQMQLDEFDDRYTRRFFLVDHQSGRTASGLEAIRYAKSIVLQMVVQENPNKLFPPKIIIEYGIGTSASWSSDLESQQAIDLLFQVEYTRDTENFWASIQVLIGFVFAVAAVVFGVRMNNWQSRQRVADNESVIGINFMLHAFMIACHVFVILFFPSVFLLCFYWFIFFKMQSEVYLLLPSEMGVEYHLLELFFHALFWCQTIVLGYTILQQCKSDVIFVDWERPRGTKDVVSMWRTILVANEWNRMQSQRSISIEFSLLLVGFFMVGLGQVNNAAPQPNFDDTDSDHINIGLRFANSVIFWSISAFIQWLWKFLLYERYITEPPSQRFVDLCTICNVSVVILMEKHKGYYLHCRSPYQSSDCSMEETLTQMMKEEKGFAIDRGLDGATGKQIFEFFCSPIFRRQISKIYSFARPIQSKLHFPFRDLRNDRYEGDRDGELSQKHSMAKSDMNAFLQHFFGQPSPPMRDGLSYVIREPFRVELLFGVTPADFRTQSEPKCILQPEENNMSCSSAFLSATFLGIELDLLVHDILTYNAVDMAFNNCAISIFLTYIMHLTRTYLRSWFGERNLARSSFIDRRFLFSTST